MPRGQPLVSCCIRVEAKDMELLKQLCGENINVSILARKVIGEYCNRIRKTLEENKANSPATKPKKHRVQAATKFPSLSASLDRLGKD